MVGEDQRRILFQHAPFLRNILAMIDSRQELHTALRKESASCQRSQRASRPSLFRLVQKAPPSVILSVAPIEPVEGPLSEK